MSVNAHGKRCACELCVDPIFARRNQRAHSEDPEAAITLTRAELQRELQRAYDRGVAEGPIKAGERA